MKAELEQTQKIIDQDPMFVWLSKMWERYPEDMRKPMTSDEYMEPYVQMFMDGSNSEVGREIVETLSQEEQILVARALTETLASRLMLAIAMSKDMAFVIDLEKTRQGMICLSIPYEDSPAELMGASYPELIVNEEIMDQFTEERVKDVLFTDYHTEDKIYFYVGYAPVYCEGEPQYAMVLIHDWTEHHDEQIQSILWMLAVLAGVLAVGGALLMLFISFATVGPVKRLRYGVQRYAAEKEQEKLRQDMDAVKSRNELGDLAVEITDMGEEIDRYMNENIRLAGEREAAEAELQLASRVQMEQLPAEYPESPHFTIRAFVCPAREVGGDFYDFFLPDEKHLLILIADVSDKGMNAAFFMGISKAMIKAAAMRSRNPVEIITEAERMLNENNPAGLFVTVWLAVIDLETGHVEACNAGHDYPAIRKQGEYTVEKTAHGPAVVFLPGVPHVGTSFDLTPGDRIFLYTDGVVEAVDQTGERFGVPRLVDTLNRIPAEASDAEIVEAVKAAVDSFAGDVSQFDDMTMLSFTYLK